MSTINDITLTMDGLLIGTGWHKVEKTDDFYIRWLGPETNSTIHLDIDRRVEYRMNITIHKSITEEILRSLRLDIDGIELKTSLSKCRIPAYMTSVIPKDNSKLPGNESVLNFSIKQTIPVNNIYSDDNDNRPVGIALKAINIFPLSRPLFIAMKYTDPVPFNGLDYLKINPGITDSIIHGLYTSAYDYYKRENNEGYLPELHSHFDECPGDLFDILYDKFRNELRQSEYNIQAEISILRNQLNRQSDAIKRLKDFLDLSGKERK